MILLTIFNIQDTINKNIRQSIDEEEYILIGLAERRWMVKIFMKRVWK